jgi:hypothetical protein
MSRRHLKALGVILIAELALLAIVVAIVLGGSRRTVFPASVPVVQEPLVTTNSSVPVSVSLNAVGNVGTAPLRARGGQAAATRADSDAGVVQDRRTSSPG